MGNLKFRIYILLHILLSAQAALSQVYPVTINSTLSAPYPIYKEDISNNNSWLISMMFNDFNEVSREVFLNLTIDSKELFIRTNKNAVNLPVYTLFPGVPVQITSYDIEQYLLSSNTFVGGSYSDQFNRNARFQEGIHNFCVEVIDKSTGKVLSKKSCNQIWIQLNDQPIVNTPQCGTVFDPDLNPNIFFQWQLLGNLSPNSMSSTEYQFTLYEIINTSNSTPQSAINNGEVIRYYQSEWMSNTTLIYDLSYPSLTKGQRYAWQVQVRDMGGRDVFKNNGFSEVCWFSYGYPEGGKINLNYPQNNDGFAKNDLQYFNWGGPNNMLENQYVEYEITIKEVYDGQTINQAYNGNNIWHFYHTERLFQDEGFDLTISKALKKLASGQKYCWKVEAFTGNQKIAESDIYSFIGPPFLESFYVDLYEIEVTKLFNNDVDNLKGEGRLIVTEDQQIADISFENIDLVNIAGRYYLENGVVESELNSEISLTLNPDNALNEQAIANIHRIKLSKDDGFMVKANINWDFYLPLIDGNPKVTFNEGWFIYDYYRLSGITSLTQHETFELLEPLGFQLTLFSSTEFIVRENQYEAIFDGYVTLPEKVINKFGYPVSLGFNDQDELYYIEENNRLREDEMVAFDALNVTLKPKDYIIDFSDYQSPFAFNDEYWKGVFPLKYDFTFQSYQNFDKSISFDESLNHTLNQTTASNNKCWITSHGLEFEVLNEQFDSLETGVKFNTFPANLYDFSLKIVNDQFKSGDMHGGILIPVISETHEFPFEVPFDFMGYTDGYLTEDLENQQFIFNANGGEQEMIIDIRRAVFRQKNHLEMDVNIGWPHFQVQMNQLDYFCVWGNYDIGFVEPNGSIALKNQVTGNASGYDITMEYIGAGRTNNLYAIGNKANIVMGEDIAGEYGPPTINAYSIMESNIIPQNYVSSYNPPFELDPNDDNLFDLNTGGSGLNLEQEYENDLGALLYNLKLNSPDSLSLSNGSNVGFFSGIDGTSESVNVQEMIESIDMLIELLRYVADESQAEKLSQIRDLLVTYDNSELAIILRDVQQNGLDVNRLIQGQINRLVHKLNTQIKSKIKKVNGEIRTIVFKPVDAVLDPFNTQIDKSTDAIFDELRSIIPYNNTTDTLLISLNTSVKSRVKNELNGAVYGSLDSNIVSKITGGIDLIITKNITNFIASEAARLSDALLTKSNQNPAEFQQIISNADSLLSNMGNSLVNEIATVNAKSIKTTAMHLAEDSYNNIDWQAILDGIKVDLLASLDDATKALVVDALSNMLDGNGGLAAGLAAGVLANVELDFTDLGSKLKSGDLSGIVKFDPTTIYLESKMAKLVGTLEFTKNDSVWGDSWQADLDALIKKPKEFGARAHFLNGNVNNYTYWFLDLAITSGLELSIAPNILMDGINGKVYHHMRYEKSSGQYFPDETTSFGLGAGAFLVDGVPGDRKAMGKSARLNVDLELAIADDYFTMDIFGTAGMGWKDELAQGTNYSNCFITGDGFIGYNSKDEHLLGEFNVISNTEPVLCAGGKMGLSIKQNEWNVYVGKRQSPISAKLFCKDFASVESWFDLDNAGFDAGFHKQINITAKSPWFKVSGVEVQPYAGFGYDFLAETTLQLEPSFKINEAALSINSFADIGANYKKKVNGETVIKQWTLVGTNLSGNGAYKYTGDKSFITAGLSGSITICSVNIGVDMDVYKVLAEE